MRAPSGNHKLRRLTLVGTIASAVGTGCHDDGEPGGASTSSGHGGSSSSQPTNSGGSTQATTGGSTATSADEAHWRQIRLHHAWSETGIDDWQLDGEPLARVGDYDWAVDEVRSPSALIVDDELWLYFAGHELDGTEPDHFAIGRLTQPLLSH